MSKLRSVFDRFPYGQGRSFLDEDAGYFDFSVGKGAPTVEKTAKKRLSLSYEPMDLIDSHAHIDFPQFDGDREAMLNRARASGVNTILAIGTGPGPEKLDAAMPYAEAHDWIYTTVGIHPHEAKEVTPAHLETLARFARHPKVIAWGEIGLDYFYDHSPRDVQKRVFREQLELASAAKLPIIIHCRDAWPDCLDLIEEAWKPTGLGGVLHCFTSTVEDAKRGLDLGFFISFTGNLTFPKAQNIRDVAKALPLENILIETDSPYLAPQAFRGKRNEPAYVGEVAKALANVRDLSTEETASATAANFRRFFHLAEPSASSVVARR